MPYQAPRGTQDLLPKDAYRWRSLTQSFAQHVHLYGYGEIVTPMFEETELFVRSSGETSEVVNKQMYNFRDKGDRDICLKPEGTAPAIRAYLERRLGAQGDVTRLWYFTQIFRYERPQKGRMRQAHQWGLELIGSPAAQADLEVLEMTMGFYDRIGIASKVLKINSIGKSDTRARYRDALLAYAAPYLAGLDSEARAKAESNPMRMLDSKDPAAVAHFSEAPSILDSLEDVSRAVFEEVCAGLTEREIPFEIDPRVVRGLDYYNDVVFEVVSTSLGSQSSLCGGGRYDGLVKELGGPPTPCVGVGMGVERAMIALEAEERLPSLAPAPIFVVAADGDSWGVVERIACELRAAGRTALTDVDRSSLKRQMKLADRAGCEEVFIIGESERTNGTVTVKDLRNANQLVKSISEVLG